MLKQDPPPKKNSLRFEDDDAPDSPAATSGQNVQRLIRKLKPDGERQKPADRLRWEDAPRREEAPTTHDDSDDSITDETEAADDIPAEDLPIDGDSADDDSADTDDVPSADDSGGASADPIDGDIPFEDAADGDIPTPTDKKAVRDNKRIDKSKKRMEKSGDKLDSARDKLAKQKPIKKPGVIKTTGRMAGREAWAFVHGKIYQVERENVGIEAAHRTELAAESVIRGGTRFVKKRIRTRPARRVRKWERKNVKATADHAFRQTVKAHPELKKNAAARYAQKKRIKKHYQKQAREAAKATKKAAEKTAVTTEKIAKAVAGFVKRHPVGSLIALIVILLIILLQSCMGMVVSVGDGAIGAIGAGTYPSEDSEMIAAEAAYAGMEAALQNELDNYASLHSGYDEYNFDLDPIEHDPYVLISLLSAWQDGAWTLAEVHGTLNMLFEHQYTLTETVTVEVRYYTETTTTTDPDTGETTTESYEVAYNYYICDVYLENYNLSHLPMFIMSEDKVGRYALYMATLGNRPDLFPGYLYPHASTIMPYTDFDILPEYLTDEVFAAMITEAEKYLGYPYVWGGASPVTSFDCSGFVSWVINHSGWNYGRLGSDGLWAVCTPVSSANAMPGDLIFFHSTYDTPLTSHVGIYVGDGMMIHCGNPISYASINTNYWQTHFFGFGRLPG